MILEWASNNGKAVRQPTVHQETTMFKAGTLPVNMYATSVQPNDKIRLERRPVECPTQTSDAIECPAESSDDGNEDKMIFLRAVMTRSGRTVQVTQSSSRNDSVTR